MLKKIYTSILLIIFGNSLISQVSIVNSMFNAYNVSTEALLMANLMNADGEREVYLEAKLYNGLNQPILDVTSSSFVLKNGVSNTAQLGIRVNSVNYSNGNDAQYIKTTHQLPSGKFRYCLFIKATSGIEGDDLCEEFENETTSFLFLTNPQDQDTIETKTPILLWNHSDPFTLLQQGEMYRMVVVELKEGQSADAGINSNSPLFMANFLLRHDVQYPFDAKVLEEGKHYGWQVQKIINNVITNKTESWEFIVKPSVEEKYNKYVELKPNGNSGTYIAKGNKIFFVFNEEYYSTSKKLNISIRPENEAQINGVKVKEDIKETVEINSKEVGHNQYEIDLDQLNLKKGYHYMTVKNEKGQIYQLKFYVQ